MDSLRSRFPLRRVALSAALAALVAPAGVAEAAKKKVVYPVVTSVSPLKADVGDTLTVRGRNFKRGKGVNQVVFKRDGARAVFVRADISTAKQIKVVLPDRMTDFLVFKDGVAQPTKFRVRVLAARFGRSFTPVSKSPTIGPRKPKDQAPPASAADGDCDGDGVLNAADADDDNDLLTDDFESQIKTDACKRDSDGDEAEDGYEYQSALDLNRGAAAVVPYPVKKPYPNPLFADAGSDYDGDGLWMIDEFRLWKRYGANQLGDLNYSDGRQKSRDVNAAGYDKQAQFLARAAEQGYSAGQLINFNGHAVPGLSGEGNDYNAFWNDPSVDTHFAVDGVITDAERHYYDQDLDGKLSDDERDEDGDGLSNWQEAHGFMTPEWWTHVYAKERPFVNKFAGTDLTDPDSDGDGIVDGADDSDFDDVPNVREMRRQLAAGEVPTGAPDYCDGGNYTRWTVGGDPLDVCWNRPQEGTDMDPLSFGPRHAWVQPFNPCLPDPRSRTCEKYPNLGAVYPPFDAEAPVFNVFDGQFVNPE